MEKYTDSEKKEMARLAKNKYMREWKRKNREKLKSYDVSYWAKKYLEESAAANKQIQLEGYFQKLRVFFFI